MNSSTEHGAGARPHGGSVLLSFLYVWLMVGFVSGTAVLIGPVQWLTEGTQALGWTQEREALAVKLVILLYVLASFFASRWLVRRMFARGAQRMRFGIPAVVTAAAMISVVAWMNPGRMLASVAGGTEQEVQLASGAEFLFGPYPDRARLEQLKREGVSAVVSLQHPAVPIEVPGIRAEREAAAQLGLSFIHAPMLPWISDNTQSLETIRELARNGRGKYYVHCGLGRDRANMVRRLIETVGAQTASSADHRSALTFADRKRQADEGEVPSEAFERGLLHELEENVWLVPHPNDRELFGYMLAGQVAHVVSLLDPSDPEQSEWLNVQRQAFLQQSIELIEAPLGAGDSLRAEEIARRVRSLRGPVAVVAPRTTWTDYQHPSDGAEAAATFYRAYQRVLAGAVPPPQTRAAR